MDTVLAAPGLAVAFAATRAPVDRAARPAAQRADRRVRTRAPRAHRLRARAEPRVPGHRARCWATWSRPTTPTPATHSRVVDLALEVADELGSKPGAAPQRRVRRPAARRRQDRGAEGDHQQAGPARRRGVGDHATAHDRGPEDARRVGGVLCDVGRIVRASHERYDGGGYPDGLAGEEIPIEARIVCCCDAFSAMTTDRSYRKARPSSTRSASCGRAPGRSSTATWWRRR